ncbi:MAG: heat-inducible transcriptional repressor HrcA [Nitrospinota bacterium]|nr:heat-inducible transcriptional repressor HrcA [Nitrospinota bacterium]
MEDRKMRVLREVVLGHIESSAPIGSRTLSKSALSDLDLSPATIRNVLADLDEEGFLIKQHSSSGRIPTEKGYRFFVEELMPAKPLPESQKKLINDTIASSAESGENSFEKVTKILNTFSHQASLMLLPSVTDSPIEKFHFLKINRNLIQAVLVTPHSRTQNILFSIEEEWNESELTELSNFLNLGYSGLTLRQIRNRLRESVTHHENRYKRLQETALAFHEKMLELIPAPEITLEGTADLLDAPEFEKNRKMLKQVLKTLSDRKRLLEIIEKCIENRKVHASLGSDFTSDEFNGCSLVTSSFVDMDGLQGTVGVMGPIRMDYPYIFGLLEHLSSEINRRFSSK